MCVYFSLTLPASSLIPVCNKNKFKKTLLAFGISLFASNTVSILLDVVLFSDYEKTFLVNRVVIKRNGNEE